MSQVPCILVVDDEADIRDLICFHVEKDGLKALTAGNGEAALSIIWDERIDLVILDLMMPGMNGLEVLQSVRENKRTAKLPVILLTAKATEVDKIIGFNLGADDYVTKPFSVKELIARVHSLLKRSMGFTREAVFSAHGLTVNFNSHKITVEEKPVEFSPKEFAIFECLYSSRNSVVDRIQILEKIWGMDTIVDERVVDVNITRMREKMGRAKSILKTVKGYGYMLDTSPTGEN
ncbi:MAG: hypothetical protein A2268_09060 [Candidatus Raymondbacteria bacterium RifOxyA12_full_50_37]|uniref:DNA-binding response regulator n=1 Tax=Candidatus Raymondbacteria bacterium RIFOXYD12_FULL_49_13 TaxID=1817890 RepID=A0A1F7F0Z1_UNCRA|nr:MAG: hypothetical protein A2268_09060 [Candidatus Raymondbacteria bacterium RifOxyA12_full_50_37]OGJ86884.1 MAG: hypothetical protein A2248_08195 [Candidatus Raymondbacteria bacterium RIFOXYA2_FULL_49_16]OGJ94790.1 MAG: hypothetical protein A2350_20710 [Candidatus Raymondbacteria bacterium RifOxyB12_full_50_8]OGJ98039.1 MAG: hypothetical protein A2487_00875 [Candidatus Raymondbacteria bacterium RifOxyC12_full_50_8]OGK00233.1 MAG: hypothetical protein A2519_07105 [Candidatus Raymondbacteria b